MADTTPDEAAAAVMRLHQFLLADDRAVAAVSNAPNRQQYPLQHDDIRAALAERLALRAEVERLRGIEQRAKNATHAAVVADMPALQAVWRAAHYILSGDAS